MQELADVGAARVEPGVLLFVGVRVLRSRLAAQVARAHQSSGMPRNQREWIKALEHEGWTRERGGKHQVKMVKRGKRPITLPQHKGRTYSKGLDGAIRRQACL